VAEIISLIWREVRGRRFSAALGDVAGITCKLHGRPAMELVLSRLSAFGCRSLPPMPSGVRSSLIKLKKGIPYVDAFGIELASDSRDHVFVTADFDFKPASAT